MEQFYFYFKAFHIISIITWMAMLFYLPRLFVYHAQEFDNVSFTKIVEIQERRLYQFIGTPALVATLLSGALLIFSNPEILKSGGWLHAKLLFVIILILFHLYCGVCRRRLLESCFKSERFFRIFNEIPTILMVIIVCLAVIRPF